MKHFKTLTEYCQAINIAPPLHPHFDIRSFVENMPSVHAQMPPFRHEFYAIAIRSEGEGTVISGAHTNFPQGATIFFNSPFQILSWDIVPDWQGYYIMFTQDFLAQTSYFAQLLEEFPFLRMDKSIPFTIKEADISQILAVFENIYKEYHSKNADKFAFIGTYTLLLLHYVKRYFSEQVGLKEAEKMLRTADLKIVTRFQTMIQTNFYPDTSVKANANLHSPSYYAEQLNIHPNHLNAVVKDITGQTALSHIHHHLLQLAKSHLAQTNMSVKEIAYALYFDSPNNFSAFFKKHTQTTPLTYRKSLLVNNN